MKYTNAIAHLPFLRREDLRRGHEGRKERNTRVRRRGGRSISLKRPTAEIKTNGLRDAHALARVEHASTQTRSLLRKFIKEDLLPISKLSLLLKFEIIVTKRSSEMVGILHTTLNAKIATKPCDCELPNPSSKRDRDG